MHEVSGDAEEVCEPAGVCEPGLGIVGRAQVRPALAAPRTVAAGAKALGDDGPPYLDVGDAGPDGFDRPRPVVAGDDRIPHVPFWPPALEHLDV